jgi:hypothetical protein
MNWIWLIGWIAPALMLTASAAATLQRHRWAVAMWVGTAGGGGFCLLAWLLLRGALGTSDRAAEIAFLQVALSSAGLFGFGVLAMVVRKWQVG